MLDTVCSYISESPDTPFAEYYQRYIFSVQDQNISAEVASIKTDDILSLDRLVARLSKEVYGYFK